MGLRSLLSRQAAAQPPTDPLTQLAAIGRTEDPHERQGDHPRLADPPGYSRRAFAPLTTEDEAPPLSLVSVEKESARFFGRQQKRESPDPRNFAVWKRQQANSIAGLFDRQF